jgi:hypothetical protein
MTRNARITRATVAIAGVIAVAIVAGSVPAYACSGQGIAATAAESPSSPPPARPSHDGSRSSGGDSLVYEDQHSQYLPDTLDARLRAMLGNALRDVGSRVPKAQSLCM